MEGQMGRVLLIGKGRYEGILKNCLICINRISRLNSIFWIEIFQFCLFGEESRVKFSLGSAYSFDPPRTNIIQQAKKREFWAILNIFSLSLSVCVCVCVCIYIYILYIYIIFSAGLENSREVNPIKSRSLYKIYPTLRDKKTVRHYCQDQKKDTYKIT